MYNSKIPKCGRLVRKPNEVEETHDYEDLPIQVQIENLKAKINLKERYNKALYEEMMESKMGAQQMLITMTDANETLLNERNEALNAGVEAVVKALRNRPRFILALRGKTPEEVLMWLDDQIGDQRRKLDANVYTVKVLQKKLARAEKMVDELEQFPFPGTLPWEVEAIEEHTLITIAISNRDSQKDCTNLLQNKYKEVCDQLKGERDVWPYTVLKLENAYEDLSNELISLQTMSDDAVRLKNNTFGRLVLTEKEYTENRRIRHQRLARIRKMCELELRRNKKKFGRTVEKVMALDETATNAVMSKMHQIASMVLNQQKKTTIQQLKDKRQQVHDFEDRARVIVEVMKVKDLRYCPRRIQTVYHIGQVLQDELQQKGNLMKSLIKQKGNWLLIRNAMKYSGCAKVDNYENLCKKKEDELKEIKESLSRYNQKSHKLGDCLVEIRENYIGMIETLNEGRKDGQDLPNNFKDLAKIVLRKILHLKRAVKKLESSFEPDSEPQKNYSGYVKLPSLHKASCRLGAIYDVLSDAESSEEEDEDIGPSGFGSDKVLTREEMKAKSEKLQGLLRRRNL